MAAVLRCPLPFQGTVLRDCTPHAWKLWEHTLSAAGSEDLLVTQGLAEYALIADMPCWLCVVAWSTRPLMSILRMTFSCMSRTKSNSMSAVEQSRPLPWITLPRVHLPSLPGSIDSMTRPLNNQKRNMMALVLLCKRLKFAHNPKVWSARVAQKGSNRSPL